MRTAVSALTAAALLAAGCGGSSKPAYCADTNNLKTSVNKLTGDATSGNLTSLQSDLSKIESEANGLVSSAKQDFPNQTNAIDSSVSSLKTAIDQLPSSPNPGQLFQLAPKVSDAINAVKSFETATSSSCG